jgi:hypothetical protein
MVLGESWGTPQKRGLLCGSSDIDKGDQEGTRSPQALQTRRPKMRPEDPCSGQAVCEKAGRQHLTGHWGADYPQHHAARAEQEAAGKHLWFRTQRRWPSGGRSLGVSLVSDSPNLATLSLTGDPLVSGGSARPPHRMQDSAVPPQSTVFHCAPATSAAVT